MSIAVSSATPVPYRTRLADARLASLLASFPAVMITGPRAVGKTSTARRHTADVARLDEPGVAAAFRADPDAALRTRSEPLLLDEWQEVPEVLGAVKRAVDDDARPGRFVLTGSVRADQTEASWPGTGRVIRLEMFPMTESEVRGNLESADGRPSFIDRLLTGSPEAFPAADPELRVSDYVSLALRSGFPEAALRDLSADDRSVWLDAYVEQLLARDSHALAPRSDTHRMRRYFEVLALNTAGVPRATTLYAAAEINARTADAYDHLFECLFVTERVPAWTSNRLARLTHAPKRFIVDAALAAAAGRYSARAVLDDGDLLGRIIETFAVAQLRPELAASTTRMRAHHVRTQNGRQEIDLVVEVGDGRIVAFEFKASAAPTARDARHLAWLRDQLGDRFVTGVVVHTGPSVFALGDRILAVPLSAMWA